ncbi:hypothetical protein FRC07_011965 [Ceratobasidium sp. 392]|nr:hypothetical protein FRC07_011965 [Ceratobasidium sp. 392]
MSNPSTTLGQKPEEILEELLQALDKHPELQLLRRVFEEPIVDSSDEQVAFASVLQTIQRQPNLDFEDILDKAVPNELKDFIRHYGTFPEDQEELDTESNEVVDQTIVPNLFGAPPFSSRLIKSSPTARKAAANLVPKFPQDEAQEPPLPPSIPLPPSPMFHEFAQALVNRAVVFDAIKEADGKPMKYVPHLPFENWGLTVKNKPSYTFIARTEVGLRNLVKWAGAQTPKKKVRVAGYRHTWTEFYSSNDEVLVMLLPLEAIVNLHAFSPTIQELQKDSDLVGIEVAPAPLETKADSTLCTIKAGTTSEMFRVWCLQNRLWCIPFNVIMVEITFGGSNGPICHGSGFGTTTLSDLVAEFHYIDPHGEPKSITDPEQLRAASGCFGLLGICTALTLRLDPMSMAVMNPVKLPLALAIPPPAGFPVPKAVDTSGITRQQFEDAKQAFIKRCKEDDYLEWFWFPLTSQVWVNTWKKVPADASTLKKLKPYPSHLGALAQWAEGWAAETLINTRAFKHLLSPKLQTYAVAGVALKAMPDLPVPKPPIKTLVSEAIHFRRGIQNMRCLDSEWEIPIPEAPNAPGERDYEKIQWAWWDAIKTFYDRIDDVPMRLTLEMRLSGGSEVLLAPQRGNNLGTISIEPLTTTVTDSKIWQSFLQQLVDKWTAYTDSKGQLLNSRPHWAKEWKGLTVRGQPIETHLKKTAYKEAIPEFVATLEKIAKAQGTTVAAMREMFGNELLERLFFTP